MMIRENRLVLRVFFWITLTIAVGQTVLAQESASFRLHESVFNAGGTPEDGSAPTSTSYRLSLTALGDPLAHAPSLSAGFGVEGGFVAQFRPPTEVRGVTFTDDDTLAWSGSRAAGSFRVYRDLASSLGGLVGECLADELATTTLDDLEVPGSGQGFVYLVSVVNRLAEEGSPGFSTGGSERMPSVPCP